MLRSALVLPLVLAAAPVTVARAQPAPATPAADSAGIGAAAGAFLAAFDSVGWAPFAAAWAEEATVFMPDALQPRRFEGREAVLGYFRQMFDEVRARATGGPPTLRILARVRDLRTVPLGPGAALVTFHLGDDPAPGRRTVVWRRGADGTWRIVHLHASRLAPP